MQRRKIVWSLSTALVAGGLTVAWDAVAGGCGVAPIEWAAYLSEVLTDDGAPVSPDELALEWTEFVVVDNDDSSIRLCSGTFCVEGTK